jgi:hypothetical protein
LLGFPEKSRGIGLVQRGERMVKDGEENTLSRNFTRNRHIKSPETASIPL